MTKDKYIHKYPTYKTKRLHVHSSPVRSEALSAFMNRCVVNDKLGTDPVAYGGFINGRRRGTREESRK